VRQTRYTYCEAADASAPGSTCPIVGALKSVDGPRVDVADVTAYAYHAATDESGCDQATGPCHRRGDLHTVTNALGHVTTHARYDRAGRLTRSIDANGVVTELSYHPRGWLLSRTVKGATAADDATTTFAYTPTGLVDRITQADGSYLDYGYDDAHRLTSVTDALGNRIDYTLDPAGNRTAETTFDPQGAVKRQLSRVYNQLGQLREQRDAQLRAYVSEYDRNGNNTASTDPLSVRSEQTFDPLNRLQQSLQDVGGLNVSTGYRYDAQDRLTKVIDPKGLHTDYTYSGLGDLTQLSSPDTGITSYTVDEAGNRRTQTDARGVTVTMQYDALNRLTRQSNSQDDEVIVYRYDGVGAEKLCASSSPVGRLSQIEDRLGLLTYCYDHRGNVIAKHRTPSKFTPPHLAVTWSVHYSHTLADQLRTLQYPDGERVIYERDAAGRIRSVSTQAANGPVATPLITQIDYAPFGPPTRIVYASGSQWTRALDADYRIDRITAPGVDYDYSLDAVGNVISIAQGAASRSFEYDDLYRVTAMKQGASVLEGFGYDATGNRTSASVGGVAQSYAYPPDSHRLQSVAGEPRSYTAAGNASLIDGLTLEYSGFNRLITIPGQRGARQRNLYNGRGEREFRESYNLPRHFGYDESGRLLFETEGVPGVPSSTVRQRYLWLDDQPIAVKNSSDAYAGEWLHIHADHLGSPRAITRPNASNAVVWRWALEGSAFGQHPAQADVDGDGVSLEFNLRYPGQYFDSATGWHYNYFRDYEPATGRYVQSDPIGLGGGLSLFGYAEQRPLVLSDFFGLSPESCGLGFRAERISSNSWLCRPFKPDDSLVRACLLGANVPGCRVCAPGSNCLLLSGSNPDSPFNETNMCKYDRLGDNMCYQACRSTLRANEEGGGSFNYARAVGRRAGSLGGAYGWLDWAWQSYSDHQTCLRRCNVDLSKKCCD
jgi:RHS repeat-associated protein